MFAVGDATNVVGTVRAPSARLDAKLPQPQGTKAGGAVSAERTAVRSTVGCTVLIESWLMTPSAPARTNDAAAATKLLVGA